MTLRLPVRSMLSALWESLCIGRVCQLGDEAGEIMMMVLQIVLTPGT